MKKIEAKIIADSINPWGDRITTMMLTFPRFILPELNTHRVFSKNSASSRAIPFKKMVEMVKEDPFIPIAWMKDHKGMQGEAYFREDECFTSSNPMDRFADGLTPTESGNVTKVVVDRLKAEWLWSRDMAVQAATNLNNCGVHYHPDGDVKKLTGDGVGLTKQLCNRLLEPYMWHTVLLTATDFDNFFELRCPCYVFNYYPENRPEALEPSSSSFKSKKDLVKFADKYGYHLGTVQELNSYHFWAELNCSEAEIHMQELAECMWDARKESTPVKLESGQWHIPFLRDIHDGQLAEVASPGKALVYTDQTLTDLRLKAATASCARLSYMTMDGKRDHKKDLELHDRLLDSEHMSPFEHCAKAMSQDDLDNYMVLEDGRTIVGRCRNFKGFIQYRKIVEDDRNRIFNK